MSFYNKQIVNITISPLNGFGMLLGLRDSALTVYKLSHLLFIFSVRVYTFFLLFFCIMKNVLNKNGKYADIMNFKTTQSNLKRSRCIFPLSTLNSTAFMYDNWYTCIFRGTKLNTNYVVLIGSTDWCTTTSCFTHFFSTCVFKTFWSEVLNVQYGEINISSIYCRCEFKNIIHIIYIIYILIY